MSHKFKSVETKYYEERQEFFDGLKRLDRRAFLRVAGVSAGITRSRTSCCSAGTWRSSGRRWS